MASAGCPIFLKMKSICLAVNGTATPVNWCILLTSAGAKSCQVTVKGVGFWRVWRSSRIYEFIYYWPHRRMPVPRTSSPASRCCVPVYDERWLRTATKLSLAARESHRSVPWHHRSKKAIGPNIPRCLIPMERRWIQMRISVRPPADGQRRFLPGGLEF